MAPFSPPFPTLVFGYASANACARPSGIDSPSPSQAVSQSVSQSFSPSVIQPFSQSNGQTVVTGTLQWHRVRRKDGDRGASRMRRGRTDWQTLFLACGPEWLSISFGWLGLFCWAKPTKKKMARKYYI